MMIGMSDSPLPTRVLDDLDAIPVSELPKLVTAVIRAHAERDPAGILHMLDALQAAGEDAEYYQTVGRLRTDLVADRGHAPSTDPVEPPELRISRYEHSLAIRWSGDPNWYRFEPDGMRYGSDGARQRVGPTAFEGTPDEEWIDPFQDPRPDIRRWTGPLRDQLRAAIGTLDFAERHPWSG